jgi:hypothetical protein
MFAPLRVFAAMLAACTVVSCAADRELPPMIIGGVERNVPRTEVEEAVRRIIANEPICLRIPFARWLAVKGRPRSVRFDAESWNDNKIEPDIEQRLDAFVDMGFLTKQPVPDHDASYAEYDWTPEGLRVYDGMGGFPRGYFCPAVERRLVGIVSTRLETHLPSYPRALRVDFSHTADAYPSWMRTEAVRERYASRLPPLGISHSTVFLYRIWRKGQHPEKNAPRSGVLEQFCYDPVHNRPDRCSIDLNRMLNP